MNIAEEVKAGLKEEIAAAVERAGLAAKAEMPDVVLEHPKDKGHGDYATNMAMQLARIAKKAPRQIAAEIVEHFDKERVSVEEIEIAGPGFMNFFMNKRYLTKLIPAILEAGERFGASGAGNGKKVLVEFVSVNPTGSLHLGHARGAAIGDTVSNAFAKAGYDVSREYYNNDAGNQIHNLTLSLEARYFQALGEEREMPEDGYQGRDIVELAKELAEGHGDRFAKMSHEERYPELRKYALEKVTARIQKDLSDFRVEFDTWFSEKSLHEQGAIEDTLALLKEKGETYEKDGATWFESTKYGDDKDRVLVKSDGKYTYLMPDIAYHLNKLQRGYDQLIDLLGPDHHGYISRMKAAVQALGYEREKLDIHIYQNVNLFQNGERVRMSKRTGKAVTLRELMEEIGVDAMRYFFAMRSSDTHLDFDMDLALSQSNENPVYYVQYAHARICSILRQGDEMGLDSDKDADLSHIASEKEFDLLKKLGEFPETVADAAEKLATHRLTNYVYDLASLLHRFYNAERVLDSEDMEKSLARFRLMKAVQQTLRNGLALLGVSAPEQM
ncbi:MAG TPA: arginine--tRNA ligase [Bacillales bacterium]|nr:arginine--tRNA ligase [Bacillales bacterium]